LAGRRLSKSRAAATRFAVDRRELRGERRARWEGRREVPVARGDERHALALALDDERTRATAPVRRRGPADLAPAHLGHRVAVEAVDDAPALLRVDEAVVDVAAVVDGVLDGAARDLVEHHPLHRHRRLEHLEQVPGDRLALAVLIGREVELVGVLQRRFSWAIVSFLLAWTS
jgi:hypothetical protein